VAVTLLVAVVAIAARGHPLGSSRGGGGLPLSFWDYTLTTIVILAVPLLLGGVVAGAFYRGKAGKGRNFQRHLLFQMAGLVLFASLGMLVIRHLHLHLPQPQKAEPGLVKPGQTGAHPTSTTRSPRFRWDELAIALGLLLVAGAIVAARRSRREEDTAPETAPEALAAALDDSLDDLRADPDLRRAIVAAYARMETALAAAGLPRHPAEAPLEYVERALLTLHTSAEAIRKLTDLFEWARFSHHEPEPAMREDAVDALIAVRDELRASELIPA
jgi:hypothetical protein